MKWIPQAWHAWVLAYLSALVLGVALGIVLEHAVRRGWLL